MNILNGWMYSGVVFDSDAQAFITASGISGTEAIAINTLVLAAKANGWWLPCLAIYPFVGGTASSCKWNLKDPNDTDGAFRLTFVNSPTFSANGVDWDGTSQYANTHCNVRDDVGAEAHLSYYSRQNTNTATDEVDMGCTDGSNSTWLSCYYNASGFTQSLSRNSSNSVLLVGTNVSSAAFYVTDRVGTTNSLYRKTTELDTDTDSAASANAEVYLGCRNSSGAPTLYTNRQCAFATIGVGLGAVIQLAMYTDVDAFQTSLSRNV